MFKMKRDRLATLRIGDDFERVLTIRPAVFMRRKGRIVFHPALEERQLCRVVRMTKQHVFFEAVRTQ